MGKGQTKLKTPVQVQGREKVRHSGEHREKEETSEQSSDQAKKPQYRFSGGKRCATQEHIGRRRGPVGKAHTKLKTPVQVKRREKEHHSGEHREKERTCGQSAHQAKNPSTASAVGKGAPLIST